VASLGAGVGLLAVTSVSAAPEDGAYVLADVQCDTASNGVLDLTLVNERGAAEAVFTVTDSRSSAISQFTVAPQSAAAITLTDLDDGTVAVPVVVDGVRNDLAVSVACDPPRVEVGEPPVLQAEVASLASAPAQLPATGSSSAAMLLGAVMVAAGTTASLAARRRHP
jgi:LPXTG-motif cell wall-anchored protein